MHITKDDSNYEQDGMTISLDDGDSRKFIDVIQNDDLFWEDIYFHHSSIDGWWYFYDANINKVMSLNDYGFDHIAELMEGKSVFLPYIDNDIEFAEFEWND